MSRSERSWWISSGRLWTPGPAATKAMSCESTAHGIILGRWLLAGTQAQLSEPELLLTSSAAMVERAINPDTRQNNNDQQLHDCTSTSYAEI
jgi:hypothetical protein